jgi:hypothetical protein
MMLTPRRLARLTPAERALYQAGYDAALLAFAQGQHTPRNPITGERDPAAQYNALRGLVREAVRVHDDGLRRGVQHNPELTEALYRCDHASWHQARVHQPVEPTTAPPPRTIRLGQVSFRVSEEVGSA